MYMYSYTTNSTIHCHYLFSSCCRLLQQRITDHQREQLLVFFFKSHYSMTIYHTDPCYLLIDDTKSPRKPIKATASVYAISLIICSMVANGNIILKCKKLVLYPMFSVHVVVMIICHNL